ncbi:MAG TPA: tetratricopeptide repeat protein [Phycisphaerae bacterium]|nr:tetratricopeptide repeat protein [Phycisphaerae bacterium]HNU44419.1 tetratricopeptide repeat protein [Phycisphaerae bacterium]
MQHLASSRRVNLRILVIVVLVATVLPIGLLAGYQVRTRVTAHRALTAAEDAAARQDWAAACRHLKVYLSKFPDDRDQLARFAEANLAVRPLDRDHAGAALAAYRRLLRSQPGDAHLCATLAKLYARVGDFNEMAYICRQRLAVQPDDAEAQLLLSQALFAQGKDTEARDTAARLVQARPDQIEAILLLSSLALRQKPADAVPEALRWLTQGIEQNPHASALYLRRAALHRAYTRDAVAARADLEAAERQPLADPQLRLYAADEWLAWGESTRATAHLEALEAVTPEVLEQYDIDADHLTLERLRLHCELVLHRGNAQEAANFAVRVLNEVPPALQAQLLPSVIRLYVAAGDLSAAHRWLTEFQSAMTGGSTAAPGAGEEPALLAALVAQAEGKPYDVINALEPLVERQPGCAPAFAYLGQAYLDTGQARRSIGAWETYLERNPADAAIALRLARLCQRYDPVKALHYARRAEPFEPHRLDATLLRLELQIEALADGPGDTALRTQLADELTTLRADHPAVTRIVTLQARLATSEDGMGRGIDALEQVLASGDHPLEAALQLATLYQRQQRWTEGIEACARAVARQPDLAAPRILMAGLQVLADQPDAARRTLQEAVAATQGAARLWARLAQAEFEQKHGSPEAAHLRREQLRSELLAVEPDTPLTADQRRTAQLTLARLLLDSPARADGVAFLEELARLDPQQVPPRLALLRLPEVLADPARAQVLVDDLRRIEGDRGARWRTEQVRLWLTQADWTAHAAEAETLLADFVRAHPDLPEPVLALGELNERLGRAAQAADLYQRCADADPRDLSVAARLLTTLQKQARYRDAEIVLNRFPRAAPALSAHRINVALALENYEQALTGLERRLTDDPADAGARLVLAWWTYRHNGDAERALTLLREAADAQNDALFRAVQVRILQAEGRQTEALALLNAAVEHADAFSARLQRAQFLAGSGRLDEAEQDYARLPELAAQPADGWGALAAFYRRAGRPDRTLAALRQGLNQAPDDPSLHRMLVEALLYARDPQQRQEGEARLADLLTAEPDDPQVHLLRAVKLATAPSPADRREAVSLLQELVERDPHNVPAWDLLIRTAPDLGGADDAYARLQRAIGTNPQDTNLRALQAVMELDKGNSDEALTLAEAVLRSDPASLPARQVLAQAAINRKDLDGALRLINETLTLYPHDDTTCAMQANALAATGDTKAARTRLEEFCRTEAGRQSLKARLALVRLCRGAGDTAAVNAVLAELQQLAPQDPRVLAECFRTWAEQGEWPTLIAALLDPDGRPRTLDPALLELGASLLVTAAQGKPEQQQHLHVAVDLLRTVTDLQPDRANGYVQQAQVAYLLGRLDAAADAYRQALAREPYHAQALNDLAWILHEHLQRPEEALTLADKGVARYPDDPHLLDTRGVILTTLGRLDAAREDLERCVSLTETVPATRAQALLHLGRVLVRQNQYADAQARLNEALTLDQQHQVLSDAERAEIERLLTSTHASADRSP